MASRPDRRRKARRPADGGATARPDEPAQPGRAPDDADVGWGEVPPPDDDDRLRQERPPHHDGRSSW